MNFMDKGIDWFNMKQQQHVSEQIEITLAEVTKVITVSVIEPESLINSEGMRVQSYTYKFLIDKSLNLDIKRGVKITRLKNGEKYEVVATMKQLEEYNDPNNTKLSVPAKLLCS